MRLYNTLTRSLEEFQPLAPPAVSMYVCGPTVYDEPHIGHARSAYIFDVLRRYLAYKGLQVRFVRNVTDVDDKIIEKARQELASSNQQSAISNLNAKCKEVAQRYLARYHQVMDQLGIQRPDEEPKATEHIDAMLNFISELVVKGAAYETKGGDVYFSVRKFPPYGALSNRSVDALQAGARVEPGEQKQDPLDFALWKAAKPDEPSWPSPWGNGRPGWHIECSAMSTKYLGDQFDIHGGGVDLVFPHHENEIAQAQAAGKPFAKHWIHNGLLTVNGEKMSKSLGNFITVDHALQTCGGEPDVLKLFFLGAHYRSPIDYSEQAIRAAGGRFDGVRAFLNRADEWGKDVIQPKECPKEILNLETEFVRAVDDDLNTPAALAALDKLTEAGYRWMEDWKHLMILSEKKNATETAPAHTTQQIRESEILQAKFALTAATIRKLGGGVFGLSFQLDEIASGQWALVRKREEARKQRDFSKADQIRQQLASEGIIVEDTERGSIVRRRR